MVVQRHTAQQGLLHVFAAVEPVGLQNVRNAAVKPLHHAVGSGRPGLGQSVLYAQFPAQLIEFMVAAGFAFLAGKQTVRELFAVVSQQLVDPDRTSLAQRIEEGLCVPRCATAGWRRTRRGLRCCLRWAICGWAGSGSWRCRDRGACGARNGATRAETGLQPVPIGPAKCGLRRHQATLRSASGCAGAANGILQTFLSQSNRKNKTHDKTIDLPHQQNA